MNILLPIVLLLNLEAGFLPTNTLYQLGEPVFDYSMTTVFLSPSVELNIGEFADAPLLFVSCSARVNIYTDTGYPTAPTTNDFSLSAGFNIGKHFQAGYRHRYYVPVLVDVSMMQDEFYIRGSLELKFGG